MPAASGFLRGYEAEMRTYTDAPDVYHQASAYAVLGGLLSRKRTQVRLDSGMPARWTNLWVILIGDSGDSRKSTALSMAAEVLLKLDSDIMAPSDGSPEGFIQFLIRRHQLHKGNASGIIVSSEFSAMLAGFQRSYSNAFKEILMEMYDSPTLWKKALSKVDWELPTPRVSMLGAIATELLPSLSDHRDWQGGFFSRALMVPARRTRLLSNPKSAEDAVFVRHAAHLSKLLACVRAARKKADYPRMGYTDRAAKFVRENLKPPPEDPILKLTLSRATVHLMKVACLEQLDEDPEATCIDLGPVQRALTFINYWWSAVPDLIDECYTRSNSDFEGDRLAKRVYRYIIKRAGYNVGVPYSELLRGAGLAADPMRRAVTSLQEAKMLKVEQPEVSDGAEAGDMLLIALPVHGTDVNHL